MTKRSNNAAGGRSLKIGLSVMVLPLLAGCQPMTKTNYCDFPRSKFEEKRNCNDPYSQDSLEGQRSAASHGASKTKLTSA